MYVVNLLTLLIGLLISSTNYGQIYLMIDPRDGKEYKTVKIGSQIWMAENMAYQIGSSEVYNTKHNYEFFYCYKNQDSNCVKYGYLYEWRSAMKVCPVGWHLPSKVEFDTLLNFVGGGNLEKAYNELMTTGNSGFNGQLGGYFLGKFTSKNLVGVFSTSTEIGKKGVIPMVLSKKYNKAFTSVSLKKVAGTSKNFFLSVRCIKD